MSKFVHTFLQVSIPILLEPFFYEYKTINMYDINPTFNINYSNEVNIKVSMILWVSHET